MNKTWTTIIIILLIVIVGVWIWSANRPTTAPVTTTPDTSLGVNSGAGQTNTGQVSVPPAVVVATSSTLGNHLVAANGMTLYRYTKDIANSGTSTCTGGCAAIWLPYLASTSEPLMTDGNATGTLATISRTEGDQIIYNGVPLYFYAKDKNPGDVTGQGVAGVWFVVKP